jgi:osmotically-inducible protein OsmY
LGAVPPIHIVVKNGNITLEGVVANEGDKNIAGIAAKGVHGAFGVNNNLRVEKWFQPNPISGECEGLVEPWRGSLVSSPGRQES